MFKTSPKIFNPSSYINLSGLVQLDSVDINDKFQINLSFNAIPLNDSDITIMPLQAEIRTDNNYLFIYSALRQKWGRIAIDKSIW